MRSRIDSGAWVIGLVLLTLGVLFLLDTTGVVEGVVSTWWPLLLLLWGGVALVRERGSSIGGAIVLLLGVGFLLENLDVIGEGWLGRYWPVALIAVGAVLVLGSVRWRARVHSAEARSPNASEDWTAATGLMSSTTQTVTSSAWRGGRATAVMAGVEVDLRRARPAAEGAVLNATAVMGDVTVRVPEDWEVVVHGVPLLGDFKDRRPPPPPAPAGARPRLEVRGTAILGDVEIKS